MTASRISLCMIVRNEAPRLPGCLDSVGDAVDEIVVVDTGSSDGTEEVARRGRARVVSWPWRDDFGAARNEALRHARGEWVLVLDADERLAADGPERLRAAVQTDADGLDCQIVSTLPAGQPSPTIASWYCRLFRRRPRVWFDGRIHEQVAPSILRGGGFIERSAIRILHEGYAQPSEAKLARNLRLLRRTLDERPGSAFALLNLGLTLLGTENWAEATMALDAALASRVEPLAAPLRAVALSHLAESHLREARWAETRAAARRALEEEPGLALARYALARASFEEGDFDLAAAEFQGLLAGAPDALGMTLHRHLAATGLGLCHLRRRRFGEAAAVLAPIAGEDRSGEAAFHLGNAYLGLHRLDEAGTAYAAARDLGVKGPDLERRLALCARLSPALCLT